MGLHVLFYHLLKYKYLHGLDGGHNVKTVKGGVKKVFLFTSVERVLVALSFRYMIRGSNDFIAIKLG